MKLQERKALLVRLGGYVKSADSEEWQGVKERATAANAWFIHEFVELAVRNIADNFLTEDALQRLIDEHGIAEPTQPKNVGIVMAGNVPLVGFHDLLCTFLCGHYAVIKPSSKDEVLMTHLVKKLVEFDAAAAPYFSIREMLKGCDAYIATGSNNSAAAFERYFAKYPHIIRKNRSSAAVLTGNESDEELEKLADDVYLYFGLGCRNVTKLYVPRDYNFERLLRVFKKYNHLADHSKYKNNYDYNLAIALLNHTPYMSNESLLMVENNALFSPIAQLNYEFYDTADEAHALLAKNRDVQCVVGEGATAFGQAQQPDVCTFADDVNTVRFLQSL